MRNPSIVPEIINSKNIQFFDNNNMPVTICKPSKFVFNYTLFKRPSILIDNLERRKYKNVVIKKVDIEFLKKLGLRLVSLRATSAKMRNRPRQSKCYVLESADNPIPNSEVLNKIPKEHDIEMDIVNKRIRIRGPNSFPYVRNENSSPWIQIIEVPDA